MRYSEIISESNDSILYRGYRESKFAIKAIRENKIAGSTTQRFWADGKRRKDNDPEYEGSYWMKGASFTRDFRFAMSWGNVVFAIDKRILQHNIKLIPLNWGYSIPKNNHHKREREEFAVTKSIPDNYNDYDEDLEDHKFNWKRFNTPEGEIKNLDKMLIGIYLNPKELYPEKESMNIILNHPKFKGFYYPHGPKASGKILPPDTKFSKEELAVRG